MDMTTKKSELCSFSIMAKPVGAACNLRCAYCYYLDKGMANHSHDVMSDKVLEAYIKQNIEAHGEKAEIEFVWHGGEPLLAGLPFYRQAVKYQKEYGHGRNIINTLQTNAILLDDEWCGFFAENGFLPVVGIDGPEKLHNTFRGKNFEGVMRGISLLQSHNVRFNTLTMVNSANWRYPKEVYGFIRQLTDNMQFLPVVELQPTAYDTKANRRFGTPPGIRANTAKYTAFTFSVPNGGYGIFLNGVLSEWKKLDKGKKCIEIFETTKENMLKKPVEHCVHKATCGHCAVVELNGDVYSCDRYAYNEYKIGNVLVTHLSSIMELNHRFGMYKMNSLPKECTTCAFLKLCHGGCPKDRILQSIHGQPGKNYLCESYKIFFAHAIQALRDS